MASGFSACSMLTVSIDAAVCPQKAESPDSTVDVGLWNGLAEVGSTQDPTESLVSPAASSTPGLSSLWLATRHTKFT